MSIKKEFQTAGKSFAHQNVDLKAALFGTLLNKMKKLLSGNGWPKIVLKSKILVLKLCFNKHKWLLKPLMELSQELLTDFAVQMPNV